MRRVERKEIAGPSSLLATDQAGANELVRARKYYLDPPAAGQQGAKKKAFEFAAYKSDDVRHALEKLFHGKCAYCESRYDVNAPVDIEHFRPKGAVEGIDHPGYWWLAAEWTNLLPSCIDCNRRRRQSTPFGYASLSGGLESSREHGFGLASTGKKSCFPIEEAGVRIVGEVPVGGLEQALQAEKALLLDPCRDDPADHLRYLIDRANPLGLVYPSGSDQIHLPRWKGKKVDVAVIEQEARDAGVSVHGAVSIHVYGLNRLALLQERTRILRSLDFLRSMALELSAVADSLETLAVASADDAKIRDWAVDRLRSNADRAVAQINQMAKADAPFSEMVKAWLEVFKTEALAMPTVP